MKNLDDEFKIICDYMKTMDLCVQVAEHAEHLGEIRDGLTSWKLLPITPGGSSDPGQMPEQTSKQSQNNSDPRRYTCLLWIT